MRTQFHFERRDMTELELIESLIIINKTYDRHTSFSRQCEMAAVVAFTQGGG